MADLNKAMELARERLRAKGIDPDADPITKALQGLVAAERADLIAEARDEAVAQRLLRAALGASGDDGDTEEDAGGDRG